MRNLASPLAGLGARPFGRQRGSSVATVPGAFSSSQVSSFDSPSAGGDRGTLRAAASPYNGGSPLTYVQWRISSDGGGTFGATQSAAWNAVLPADYPMMLLATTPVVVQARPGNVIGPATNWYTMPSFTPTVTGAPAAPTVSATGLAPPAITAYRSHSGTTTYDTTQYFGAEAATGYVLATPVMGVLVNQLTGQLTVDHTLARVGVYDIVVYKFNATGVAHSAIVTLNVLSPLTLQSPQRWGASTPSGKGALDTSKMAGGPLANGTYVGAWGTFSVTSGIMTPTAVLVAGSYTIGGLDFLIFAGRTASTIAELQAAISNGANIEGRGPTAGGTLTAMTTADLTNRFNGFTTRTTLANADDFDEVLIRAPASNFAPLFSDNAGIPAFVTFNRWNFRATSGLVAKHLSAMPVSTRYCVLVGSGAADCEFIDCAFTSNAPIAAMTGQRQSAGVPGIHITSAVRLNIVRPYITQTHNGINITNGGGHYDITIESPKIWGVFTDGIYSGASDGSGGEACNIWILNADFGHFRGDHGFHCDPIQMAPTVNNRHCTGIIIRGISFNAGILGMLCPAYPTIAAGNGYPALPSGKSAPKTADYTAPITSFHHDVDPSAGSVVVQLPAQTVKTMNGIQKWGESPNVVVVLPPPGTQILLGSTLYDQIILIDPWEFIRFQYNTVSGLYEVVAQANGYQGIFLQGPPGTGQLVNFQVDHNLVGATIAPGTLQDTPSVNGGAYVNNTTIPPMPGRLLASGRVNSYAQGFDPTNEYLTTIGSNTVMKGNIGGVMSTGGVSENPRSENHPIWFTPGGKTWAAINALFPTKSQDSSQTAQHLPMSRAETIAALRMRAVVAVSDIGMGGGLAVNPADDKYDYVAGVFLNNRPWQIRRPVFTPAAGGGDVAWLSPSYLGDGVISSYDLRHKLNGGAYTTVAGVSPPYTISGLAPGSLVIEIRANNANGSGPWTVMPAQTIT